MEQKKKGVPVALIWLLALVGIGFIYVQLQAEHAPRVQTVAISDLVMRIERDEVKSITINQGNVNVVLKDNVPLTSYTEDVESLANVLEKHKVEYRYIPPPKENPFVSLLTFLIVPILFLGVAFFLFNRMAKGQTKTASKFGSHKGNLVTDKSVKTRFTDVAGANEAVEQSRELVEMLANPKKFRRLGGKIPRGVLLMGPPGTGKTLLAKAIAGEAGCSFISTAGSGFVEMFVGVGASRVRDLFEHAQKHAPCIVFIDEIDAVGRSRGGGYGGGHDEREQTLNQLLVEMDGFDNSNGVIVMAATNRPEILDEALIRPGRFDRKVVINRPDVKGREAILRVHAANYVLTKDVDFSVIARGTPGMTGADLALVLNEAAIICAREDKPAIDMHDINRAKDIVIAGEERRSAVLSDRDKRIVAYHEAGHAVVMHFTPDCDPVHRVSIIPRGMSLGQTQFLPEEEHILTSKNGLTAMIHGLLGGRAAEELVIKDVTSGAADDLKRASGIARYMTTKVGMTDLGLATFGDQHQSFLGHSQDTRNYSESTARKIDAVVRGLVDGCYEKVKGLLTEKKDLLDKLAKELIEKETVFTEDVVRILGPRPGSTMATESSSE
jgi:cell division protease FtsH